MFSTQSDNCILIHPYFDIISLFAAEFEEPKIGISGKGLKMEKVPGFSPLLKCFHFNSLSNYKILDWTKFKAFADN